MSEAKISRTIIIPGDLTGTINLGTGNKVNGQELANPTLPPNAIVTETSFDGETEDLGAKIRREVAAKIAAKMGGVNTQGGIHIGGESRGSTIINQDNLRVDRQQTGGKGVEAGTERTLAFRAGNQISNGNMNGVQFDGVWKLKTDETTGQPIKQGGQFVYVKQ